MISANELRIGNWILALGLTPTKVEGFSTWDDIVQSSFFAERPLADFEPIILTPEILEKAGFKELGKEYNPSEKWFEIEIPEEEKKVSINLKESAYCVGDSDYFHEVVFRSKMEVHTLQNLYFSIFGKELEINL